MEVINNIQKLILEHFSETPGSEHFYLTGGTALSEFYLKHRRSDDLDFFTASEELIVPFSYNLEKMLKSTNMAVERRRGFRSFIELLGNRGQDTTIIHLALDSPFRFEPPEEFPRFPGLKVDSLIDLASNKILALFGRATLRDFIDVYALVLKEKFKPGELEKIAGKKDPGFDLYWLGVAFERIKTFNADSPGLSLLIEPVKFRELLDFFNDWREDIAKSLKE